MDTGNGFIMSKTQRLVLGSFVLILVDIIWVLSSELTKVNISGYELFFFYFYM